MADSERKYDSDQLFLGCFIALFFGTMAAVGVGAVVAQDASKPAAVARSPGLFWVAAWKTDMALADWYIEQTREVIREIKCRDRETRACWVCSRHGLEAGLERLRDDAADADAGSPEPPDETEGTAL